MFGSNLILPEKLYVGLKSRNDGAPIAYITSNISKSSIKSVQAWSNSNLNYKKINDIVIDNIPLNGFKIGGFVLQSNISKTFGDAYNTWNIIDPRGFVVEVTSTIISQLVANCTIENGEILAECIWARYKSKNVLLPTNSKEYEVARSNFNIKNTKESWKNAKIGNTVLLKNGVKGQWLGRMYPTYRNIRISKHDTNLIDQKNESSVHVIFTGNDLYMSKSPSLSKILDNSTIDKTHAEILANEIIKSSSRKNCVTLIWLSFNKKTEIEVDFKLTPVTVSSAKEVNTTIRYFNTPHSIPFFVKDAKINKFGVYFSGYWLLLLDYDKLINDKKLCALFENSKNSFYNNIAYVYDTSADVFNLEVNVKTKLNEISFVWHC